MLQGAGVVGEGWLEAQPLSMLLAEWDASATAVFEKSLGAIPAHRHP